MFVAYAVWRCVNLDLHMGSYAHAKTHLKNVFWPKLGVGHLVQALEILQYSSGLRPSFEE